MNIKIPSTEPGLWRRTSKVLSSAALTMGLLAAAPTAEAQTVYGLTPGLTPGGAGLVTFNAATIVLGGTPTLVPITGVTGGQVLVGIDSRPATGELFALGYNGAGSAQLYTLNPTTGVATTVGGVLPLALGAATERIGFDFNPTVDRIRVTSSNDANFRLNPNNGALAATDGAIKFPAPSTDNPVVGSVAYTNSFQGTASTTLYDIDESRSTLYIQNPPNEGVLSAGVAITRSSSNLLTAADQTDLDIYTDPVSRTQSALLAVNFATSPLATAFFNFDLATGNASLITSGFPGLIISDIAFAIDRTAPAPNGQLLYAVNTNNALLSFYSGTPGFINTAVGITGLTAGQALVGTDFRPNTGELIGMGYDAATAGANSQLYTINLTTAVATPVGPAIRLELGGANDNIGFDFNPTVDRIRVVSTNRADFRLNPNNGALAATDGQLTYAAGDINAGATPRIGSVGYTNSFAGSTGTTLYDIDEALSTLAIQNPPNAGTLNTVGTTGLGIALNQANALVDLDIYFDASASLNRAFLTANPGGATASNLYTLDLATAATTLVGTIGLGIPVRDISAVLAPTAVPNSTAALTGRLLYGVAGGNLVSFDSGNPSVIRTAVNITGLGADQVLVGTDFRPANGMLYALGYNATTQQGQLYTLEYTPGPTAGALSAVGSLQAMPLGATAGNIGFDFNPVPDRIRITSASNQANLRMNPADGTFITDGTLTGAGGTPTLSGVAYTNNDNNPVTGTMLFGYDQARNVLLRSTDANLGTYVDQGPTGISVANGVEFDIFTDLTNPATPTNTGFLAASLTGTTTDNLYTIDLASGATSLLGRVGNGSALTGLAAFLTPAPVVVAGLTWTGAVSTDWGTAGNWSPAQVPTAADNVTIPDVANDPVVSNAQQANGVTLASGATLTTANGGTLTLSGSLTNNGGTTLGTGTGTVAFAGAAAQTVSGTTTFFNNLTAGPAGLTAAAPVQVQRVLLLNGNLTSNGNLTLLSNATGTAHVVNASGTVAGNATVQRYITPTLNNGPGYRHYSAPVSGSTVGDLTTPGFTPVVNPAYNTAAVPNSVTPFPTVFGYDETRVNTSGSPAPQDFDKGFFSPNALSDAMEVTRGYTVNVPASQTVDFVGTLNNGTYNASGLSRGTQSESGYQLLGNPYPSPIDWDLVGRTNVDAAVYVYRSTGQYAGTYSTYVADGTGTNGGTDQIPVAQGFFVRVSTPGSNNGQVSFANAARLTTYASPIFQRSAATAPLVRLDLRGATGSADEAVVYFDAAATAGFDSSLDAYKLVGGNGPLVASEIASPLTALSVNALPALTAADVVVNLRLQAGQAGTYTLRAAELLRLPAGTFAFLRDAQTGARIDLSTQPEYSFQLATGVSTGRFSLLLTQQAVLSNAPAALTQQVSVFPNPARGAVSIALPAALARQATEVQVINALGQTVLRSTLAAGNTARTLSLDGVARGVYTLRLQTEQGTVNKRLVVE
ncbi:DUF4394 domain-containing protein [Hymenobacter arizonensis]|uniref:Por secretion system C-terminal sorting domain-containing protein n=1 Tax=Hymenobacter arizonensis TaxID=1227077 RepID=A0A1I5XIG9_HYMAR|nr:DUF4394 domain-containing protein [Hymenobacter arizonensis]SFQ31775.1 Por secretion system C-terminal sorting domain-containing protein [Hymenobacter arizonensis]